MKEGLQQGMNQGVAIGATKTLLALLEARRLELTDDDRKRIPAMTNTDQLDRMVRRAATTTETAEIFE